MDSTPTSQNLPDGTRELISRALQEDRVDNDVSTLATVPADLDATGRIIAREPGVIAGTVLLTPLFEQLGGDVTFSLPDAGASVEPDEPVVQLDGPARTLLTGERVALNFLQHLSGVATLTRSFVQKVHDLDVDIVDTRKTTPGWRALEKRAVRLGGGKNHRMNLSEMAMIKENHLTILRKQNRALQDVIDELEPSVKVQVEVDSMDELETVLPTTPSLILLDNMSVRETTDAVSTIRSYEEHNGVSIDVEASGGIDLDRVRPYAETGVDRISVGSLTHSAPAVDLSMRLDV